MAHCVKTSADLAGPVVKSRHFWTRKLVRPSARSSSLSRRNRWVKLLGACPACLRGSGAIPHLISNYAGQAEDEQGINALLETQQKVFDTLEKEYHEKVEALAASTKKTAREAESLKASRKREDRANKKALKKKRSLAKAKKRLKANI